MPAAYGVDGLFFFNGSQYITTGAASDESAALHKDTIAVSLTCLTADMWVAIGEPGKTATAAAAGAETTRTATSFPMHAGQSITLAVPRGTDTKDVNIAAIQDGGAGQLDIIELKLA
jgi:hypothetical protein